MSATDSNHRAFASIGVHLDGATHVTTHVYENQPPILSISFAGSHLTLSPTGTTADDVRVAQELAAAAQAYATALATFAFEQAVSA